ncbi:MAG TPA: hypothetical protein VFZ93_08225 [Albitalea sp.]
MNQALLSRRRVRAHAGVLALVGALAVAGCGRPDETPTRAQDAMPTAAHPGAAVATTAPGTTPVSAVPAPVSRGPAVPPAGHGTPPDHGEGSEVDQGPASGSGTAAAASSTPGVKPKAQGTQR